MLKRIKAKLKSKSGLTLTEMLITVILLMFFSSACLLGISTALSTRKSMIKAADADILCSTVTQYISNEIRLSLKGKVESGRFKYDGGSTYANLTCGSSELWLNDKGQLMRKIGNVTSGTVITIDHEYPVFNDSAYSGFKLADLKFEIIEDDIKGDKIKCSFVVKDGDTIIRTGNDTEFTVTPITPITAPGT